MLVFPETANVIYIRPNCRRRYQTRTRNSHQKLYHSVSTNPLSKKLLKFLDFNP